MADEPSRAEQRAEFERRAIDARHHGHFQQAATLFREAADLALELQDRLNLQLREACCFLAMERHDEAVALAFTVADLARVEQHLPELVDALGMIADHFVRHDRLAEATHALAEAAHVLDDLPTDAGIYLVLQNLAVTYTHCGFIQPALELYDRALRVAATDLDRPFTYANLAASYHLAALTDTDPARPSTSTSRGSPSAATVVRMPPSWHLQRPAQTTVVSMRRLSTGSVSRNTQLAAGSIGLISETRRPPTIQNTTPSGMANQAACKRGVTGK